MRKITLPERPDLAAKAAEVGFTFAHMHGEPYWDESSAYQFTLAQIEDDLEGPATELHAMTRDAVDRIVADPALMDRLGIPQAHHALVAGSWARGEPEIYGRMDLAYDGTGPAKLLEYNADTPTSFYESAAFQWQMAGGPDGRRPPARGRRPVQRHPRGAGRALSRAVPARHRHSLHRGRRQCRGLRHGRGHGLGGARGRDGRALQRPGQAGGQQGRQFLDANDKVIGTLFKLYPWEDLLTDDFARHIAKSGCMFLEPAWKAVVSNKGLLPVLWQMFPGHPNLLPAFFADDVADALVAGGQPIPEVAEAFAPVAKQFRAAHVVKPIFSREGAGVVIVENGDVTDASENRDYDGHARIVQAYHALPEFDGFRPVIGAWIVGPACAGIGIREDRARITQDLSRFKPHFIAD